MRRKKILLTCISVIVIIIISYIYGIASHRHAIFPYPEIKHIATVLLEGRNARQLHDQIEVSSAAPLDTNKRSIGLKLLDLVTDRRVLESLTVPILATVVDIGSLDDFGDQPVKGPKGGICISGSSLVAFDSVGNGVLVELSSMTIQGYVSVDTFKKELNGRFFKVLDVACDKNDDSNYAYIAYDIYYPDAADIYTNHRTMVGRIRLDKFHDAPVDKIWESQMTHGNHAGRLALLPDNRFLITFSHYSQYAEFGEERQPNGLFTAEDESLLQGKVIEVNKLTGEQEIFSKGHRVSQGLFATQDGKIFQTEHGPKGGDELNLIVKGGNYGWPHETHGVEYTGYSWMYGEPGRHDNFNRPVFAWVPSIAISNLLQIRGFHKTWVNDIVISSLKAQSIFRTRVDKDLRAEFVEQIWIGTRIRDIEETNDSKLVLWTDDSTLIFLSVESEFLEGNKRTSGPSVEVVKDAKTLPLIKPCLQCHHFGFTNKTHMAPSLSYLFSRKIASDNFIYSDALSSKKGRWKPAMLKQYIMNPQSIVPGSTMVYRVEDDKKANRIVDLLIEVDNMGQ